MNRHYFSLIERSSPRVDDVYIFTNQNNDQFTRFEIGIPEENAPKLKPPKIHLGVNVNSGSNLYVVVMTVGFSGDYSGTLDIPVSGQTNFCLNVGVYVEEEDIVINEFEECKSL